MFILLVRDTVLPMSGRHSFITLQFTLLSQIFTVLSTLYLAWQRIGDEKVVKVWVGIPAGYEHTLQHIELSNQNIDDAATRQFAIILLARSTNFIYTILCIHKCLSAIMASCSKSTSTLLMLEWILNLAIAIHLTGQIVGEPGLLKIGNWWWKSPKVMIEINSNKKF